MVDIPIRFSVDDIQIIDSEFYPTDEFAIAKLGFLGSNPNHHQLEITDEVLQNYADTVLGKFVVAYIDPVTEDATSHVPEEFIQGYFPREQKITFVEKDGYLRAYADAVISKIYAPDFCAIFENGDKRDVSVEMTMQTEHGKPVEDKVLSFNITGVTVLGRRIQPSSPGSDMRFTRFSTEDAIAYFEKNKEELEKREDKNSMAEEKYENHPIDTSKDSLYEGEWDGDKAKADLIKEEKYETLAPKVCLRLEEGWKDRQVTKLGYPVMCLHEGKWVYSRKGLASALGYAKQHNDNDIVSKVESIYKKLGLDSEGKEESAKMNEIEFSAVDIGDMWGKLYNAMRNDRHWDYYIQGVYEQDNKKFAIVRDDGSGDIYRLDFSLTEEGLTLAEEIVKVNIEFIETDDIRKFATPDNAGDFQKNFTCDGHCDDDGDDCDGDDSGSTMSYEDMAARIAELEKDIADRDNIIMEKDTELEDLRKFKNERLEQDKAAIVASVLGSVEDFMDKTELESCREEGMACDFAKIDGWSNKVKASIVDKAIKKSKKSVEFTRISANVEHQNKVPTNVWDRL